MSVRSLPISLVKNPVESADSRHSKDCASALSRRRPPARRRCLRHLRHSPGHAELPPGTECPVYSPLPRTRRYRRKACRDTGAHHTPASVWSLHYLELELRRRSVHWPGPALSPSGRPCRRQHIFWLGFGAASILMAAVWSTWSMNMPPDRYGPELLGFVKATVVVAVVQALVHISLSSHVMIHTPRSA